MFFSLASLTTVRQFAVKVNNCEKQKVFFVYFMTEVGNGVSHNNNNTIIINNSNSNNNSNIFKTPLFLGRRGRDMKWNNDKLVKIYSRTQMTLLQEKLF